MSRPPTLLGGGSAHVPGTSSLVNSICKIGEIVKRFSAMNVQFTDNSKEVLEAMQQAAARALEKCGLTHVHIKRYKYHYTRCAIQNH